MRVALLLLAFFAFPAWGQEVARLFGKPVSAAELKLADEKSLGQAAGALRQRVLKEAMERFIAQHKLEATEADLAAYERFESEFQRLDRARRASRRQEIEAELKVQGQDPAKRQRLEKEREVLASLEKHDTERASMKLEGAGKHRVWRPWIASYKANKALYEKYGGRVGITKWGPDPVGAIESLLREHESRKEFVVLDAALAKEFWAWYAAQPRMPAKTGDVDFTYYWLKPAAAVK